MILKFSKMISRFILKNIPLILFPKVNVYLYKILGYDIAKTARIYSSVQMMGNIEIIIGNHTFIGHETLITGGNAKIVIGKNCDISDRVNIFCGTHKISIKGNRIAGQGIGKDIYIGEGVWIGFGSYILPGVKIGEKSIIAAGTVVHKDVPAYNMVGGNPMKIIRKISIEEDEL